MTISLSAFLFLFSCHVFGYDEQDCAAGNTNDSRSSCGNGAVAMGKVDPEVSALIDRIADMDRAPSTSTAVSLSALSTPTLRVDDRGRIQLYIHVSSVDENMRELLGEAGAEIELQNPALKVYQAWVPATVVRAIAAADAVRKVTPPSYASHR